MALSLAIPATFAATPSVLRPSLGKQLISHTGDTAIKLGDTSAPGYVLILNLDATNYVELKTASSGTIFARLDAAVGFAFLKLGSGAQAPAALANTADCLIESFIIPS
ncbi:MAG: hypothetical protein V4510_12480 [bacterium]